MSYRVVFTKHAQKDAKKLSSSGLKANAQKLLEIIKEDPWKTPPPYEKLVGNLAGAYSRRINIQHRLVYQLLNDEHVVKVLRMWLTVSNEFKTEKKGANYNPVVYIKRMRQLKVSL